jgi:hypothetical protein
VARDQRTRLHAELAAQYGSAGTTDKAPGRNALTEENPEHEELPDGELDEQHEPAAAEHDEQHAAVEPKKSIFELPRKEPARPPLVPDTKRDP